MLQINQSLPSGALIGREGLTLSKALQRTNGAWFAAREDRILRDGDRITGWREASDGVDAMCTEPNTGNSQFDPGPPTALLLSPGVHCGFVVPDFTPEVESFTAAVIYTSPANAAKTLFAVSTGKTNNLIFLSESDGMLFAKDRENTALAEVPVPANPTQARLAILTFSGRRLVLQTAGKTINAEGTLPGMAHPGHFFIGCRSNRSGLTKTLGLARLHDVVFWPDRALLGSSDPDDTAALSALNSYHRWAY
ncbi:hypothetical protein [Tabrizicola sp.]|uniref:hypothetical protein n=1 Tax=Tabrizicola sp. TaxID=2005166 RepID=UPI00286D23DE|nr:hypothetical protein [Tabrizicola sp.]